MPTTVDPDGYLYPPLDKMPPRTAVRIAHSRVRRRLLEGNWECDLEAEMLSTVAKQRAENWRVRDMSSNVARDVWSESSALYVETPIIDYGEDTDILKSYLDKANWSAVMAGFQPYVVAQREGALAIEIDTDGANPVLRLLPVYADMFDAHGPPDAPEWYAEWDLKVPAGATDENQRVWVRRVWDIRDRANPTFRIERVSDVTGQSIVPLDAGNYVPEFAQGKYPWRYSDGTPFIPRIVYHAKLGSRYMFSPTYGAELVYGTLRLAVELTFADHCFIDASWPQRNVKDLQLNAGIEQLPHENKASTEDPATIQSWRSQQGMPGEFFQWDPGAKPAELLEYIKEKAATLLSSYGINGNDVQRMSADPRSGVAISLSNEGKRTQIRNYKQPFSVGDRETIRKVAACLRIFGRVQIRDDIVPNVLYGDLPMSSDERKARADDLKQRIEIGIASRVDAYMEMTGTLDRKRAMTEVKRVIAEEKALSDEATPEPATSNQPPDNTDTVTPDTVTPDNGYDNANG